MNYVLEFRLDGSGKYNEKFFYVLSLFNYLIVATLDDNDDSSLLILIHC